MSDLRPHEQDLVRLSLPGFLRHGDRRTKVCETKDGTPGSTKIAFSGSGALRVDEAGRPLQPHWTTVFGLEQYQGLQGFDAIHSRMRGNMIVPHVHASRTAKISRRSLRLGLRPDAASEAVRPRRSLLGGLGLFLLPLSQGALVAQPAPPSGQGWSPSNSYGMYAPEPTYGRQGYSQPQPYLQQPQRLQSYPSPDAGYQQAGVQPLGAEQLEQLVAPIALYPDVLLAQVLSASTYPDQVRYVDQWRRAQGNAAPEEIAAGADEKNWDPSLKALTAFPQVLEEMARNLQWTSDLGNAYYNQPQDVMGAVQMMRQRAQAAGSLQSTPQEAVSYEQGNIELAPPNPDVVHVPSYDPWSVYGRSVSPYPGFSSLFGALGQIGQFVGSSPVSYGLGILMTVFNHTPWGWLSWGLSWLTQSVLFQHNNYYSHSATVADWGLPYGGPRAFRGYRTAGYAHARGPLVTRNNFGPPASMPAMYSRSPSSYGYGRYGRTGEFNRVRPGSVYGRPDSFYRQTETSYSRSGFRQPVYRSSAQGYRALGQRTSFPGGYPGKARQPGGLHLFGSGHSSKGFSGGSHKANFGGGHGLFGGHSGGHFGGHGSGGGHSHGHHH
jgi:Protein of unknown function (DUF3300)